jgi:hypothetical protein
MATTQLKLSSKTDANGRSQVIVKLTISRQNRPCFKSGVFISPEWFRPIQETKKGFVYDVVVPKKGKLNVLEVREAETAKSMLVAYVGRLTAVCNALVGNEDVVNHDSIEDAMTLTRNRDAASITYQVIKDARLLREQEDSESSTTKTFFEWMDYYLSKKDLSEGRKRGFRVLVRILSRYQSFIRLTDKQRKDFTLDIHTLDKETVEDFFDYMANEKSISEEYPEIFKSLLADYPVEFTPKHKNSVIEERGHNIMVGRKNHSRHFIIGYWNRIILLTDPLMA